MSSANKEVVRREIEEIINRGNYAVMDELIADNYVAHDPTEPAPLRGRKAFRESLETFRAAFPDLNVQIQDQLAEGDLVVTRWVFTGQHEGELFGIPATGNAVKVTGISIERLVDGMIAEDWMELDLAGLMQQLGVGSEAHVG